MCVDALFTCSSVQSRIKKEEARNITHSAYVGDKYHKEIFPAYYEALFLNRRGINVSEGAIPRN